MNKETFEPRPLNVKQLLCDSDSLYQIPNYQRPYSWQDEEVLKLWDDIYEAYENNKSGDITFSEYFLGSIITIFPQDDSGYQDVVDGQQRLTTLMILICTIRDIFPDINETMDSSPNVVKINRIKKSIYDDDDMKRLKFYTHPNHMSDFEENILDGIDINNLKKPSKRKINESPKFKFINTAFLFKNKLEEIKIDTAGEFLNYLYNQVKIIKITCSNRPFAIKLFQVLNNRGLDLTPADLVKSYLLSKIKEDKKQEQFMADWQYIEKVVGDTDVTINDMFIFYEYYLLCANPKKSLSEELEEQFKNLDSNDVIKNFKKFTNIYKEEFIDTENKYLHSFWYLRWAMYWKTILLTAHHTNYYDIQQLMKILRRFYYLYWIAGKTLTQIKQTSFKLIKWINEKQSIEFIQNELNNKIKKDEILGIVLKNLTGEIYYESWVKPLYLLIEYNQIDSDFMTIINWNKDLHIEHILPTGYKSFEQWNHITDEISVKYINTCGNLTLLSGKKNIEASNNPFDIKISVYKGKGKYHNKKDGITAFRITQKIVDEYNQNKYSKMWTKQSIVDRWNWFCDQVGEILEIDTSSIKK